MTKKNKRPVIAQCEQKHIFVKVKGSKKLCSVCFPPVKTKKEKAVKKD